MRMHARKRMGAAELEGLSSAAARRPPLSSTEGAAEPMRGGKGNGRRPAKSGHAAGHQPPLRAEPNPAPMVRRVDGQRRGRLIWALTREHGLQTPGASRSGPDYRCLVSRLARCISETDFAELELRAGRAKTPHAEARPDHLAKLSAATMAAVLPAAHRAGLHQLAKSGRKHAAGEHVERIEFTPLSEFRMPPRHKPAVELLLELKRGRNEGQ